MQFAQLILALGVLLTLGGCRAPQPSTYGYESTSTTGIGHRIIIDGKAEPVLFSEQSDPMARWSLCHLRWEVAYGKGNEITMTGMIEKHVPKPLRKKPVRLSNGETTVFAEPEDCYIFKITGWKLKAPFRMCHYDIDGTLPATTRHTLRRDDFTSSTDFDPQQAGFDPAAHVQK